MSREPWCVDPLKILDTSNILIHVIINNTPKSVFLFLLFFVYIKNDLKYLSQYSTMQSI